MHPVANYFERNDTTILPGIPYLRRRKRHDYVKMSTRYTNLCRENIEILQFSRNFPI